jgi:hypothetical protein
MNAEIVARLEESLARENARVLTPEDVKKMIAEQRAESRAELERIKERLGLRESEDSEPSEGK